MFHYLFASMSVRSRSRIPDITDVNTPHSVTSRRLIERSRKTPIRWASNAGGVSTASNIMSLGIHRVAIRASAVSCYKPLSKAFSNRGKSAILVYRTYATHRDPLPNSSLLSHALDQRSSRAGREDSMGAFRLGLVPPTPNETGNVKKWSELSLGGKGALQKTASQKTN